MTALWPVSSNRPDSGSEVANALCGCYRESGEQLLGLRSRSSGLRGDSTTVAEAETQIREAIEFHLEGLREDGLPIPPPSSQVEYIEIVA